MIDHTKTKTDQDRRDSVRVTGRNLFNFLVITPEKFAAVKADFNEGIPPYNQEGLADIQVFIGAQSALVKIRERDEDLGDFLSHLDNKMNLLLKRASKEKTLLDKLTLHDLNLSGKGIAFVSATKVEIDDILEFHIALLPTYTYIYCFGKLLSCEELQRDGRTFYKLGCEFVLIMEEDQEKLIQHNFRQQSLALRNRRKARKQL